MKRKALKVKEEQSLTAKQRVFLAEWAVDFDAVRAVKAAGYKGNGNTMAVMANRLKNNPLLKKAMDKILADQQDEARLDRKQVLKKVADNLHRDLNDLCDERGLVFDNLKKIPKRTHAFIDGLDVMQYFDKDGNVTSQRIKIKLSPSATIQDIAMKHVGAYAPDKLQVQQATVDLTQMFKSIADDEEDPVERAIEGVGR